MGDLPKFEVNDLQPFPGGLLQKEFWSKESASWNMKCDDVGCWVGVPMAPEWAGGTTSTTRVTTTSTVTTTTSTVTEHKILYIEPGSTEPKTTSDAHDEKSAAESKKDPFWPVDDSDEHKSAAPPKKAENVKKV